MGKSIEPISELNRRVQEQGRIRLGVKDPSRGMRAIDTFRFTSPDEAAIRQLADIYGGEARPWSDDRANVKHQFEVISKASKIRVLLVPNAMSQYYELWSGGGCQRRCDGVTCEVPINSNDSVQWEQVPCPCEHQDKALMCKIKTRLTVILPEIRFAGGWRVETSSMNAAAEMPGMEAMISGMQQHGITEGVLEIAEGKSGSGKNTKRYKYPKLSINVSMEELAAGAATFGSIPAGPRAALEAGDHQTKELVLDDDDPVDVEVIEAEVIEVLDEGPWSTMKEAMQATGCESSAFVKQSPGKWVRR